MLARWRRSLLAPLRRWRSAGRLPFPPDRLTRVWTRDGQPLWTPKECVQDGKYYAESWEPYTITLFLEHLQPGYTVLDLGAHVGYYTLMAARAVGRRGLVYALEPGPAEAQLLAWNVRANGHRQVRIVRGAVGDRSGSAQLSLSGVSSMHSLVCHHLAGPWQGSITVPMLTVDELLQGRPVDVVKMDVEGAEPLALQGMRATIQASPRLTIFSEFSPDMWAALSLDVEAFVAQLLDLGFQVSLVDEWQRRLVPVPRGKALETYHSLFLRGHLLCQRGG